MAMVGGFMLPRDFEVVKSWKMRDISLYADQRMYQASIKMTTYNSRIDEAWKSKRQAEAALSTANKALLQKENDFKGLALENKRLQSDLEESLEAASHAQRIEAELAAIKTVMEVAQKAWDVAENAAASAQMEAKSLKSALETSTSEKDRLSKILEVERGQMEHRLQEQKARLRADFKIHQKKQNQKFIDEAQQQFKKKW